jgi:hypothetical protein
MTTILSKGGLVKAVIHPETNEGVKVTFYHRARNCGTSSAAPWKLIDSAIYNQPFHVVRDAVHDGLQR